MNRILIVEDDKDISRELKELLENSGYEAVVLTDFKNACDSIIAAEPDLVLLDINIPYMNGEMLLQQLRSKSDVPVIMVTSRDSEADEVLSMSYGADDYITKPFSPREVLARIKAVIRRTTPDEPVTPPAPMPPANRAVMLVGDLQIDQNKYRVARNGKNISLTPKEFELLVYFVEREGRVLSRDAILNHVWGYDYASETRIVDIHISHLREKIEADPKQPRLIRTVRGFGYEFVGDGHA